ncbi:MAG: hypothetical protein CL424_06570 [Acidimicrobiaceae bacterium]|nr:hypothetical protein [Acidimicrobiaceae bacterium]
MPHLSWAGTPRDHRFASLRSRRRAVSALVVGCLVAAACTGDDTSSIDAAAEQPAADGPADSTTAPAEPVDATALEATATSDPATAPTDPPPTTESVPARCGDDVDPSGPVTITVWHGLGGHVVDRYLPGLIDRFQLAHPGILVELVKGDLQYPSGLPEFADSGSARPDVLYGSNLTVRTQAESGLFIPVEACTGGEAPPQFDDLLPAVDRLYRVDGTLWGAPYNVSTPLLMYDGNVWREAGLDPDDPPATIEELLDTARRLHAAEGVAHGLVLYNKSALWLLTETAAKEGRLLIEPANGHDGDVELVRIVTDEAVALFDELRQMKADGVVSWTRENTADEDLLQLVQPISGSGMTLHTSAALGDIFRLLDEGLPADVDVRVAPMPGPGPGATPGGGSWWLTDGQDPDRVAAAWKFVDWITQPERVAELAAYTGYIPTTRAAVDDPATVESWEAHPQMRVAYEQGEATPATPAAVGLQVGAMVEFLLAIEYGLAEVIDNGADPRTELDEAVGLATLALDAYSDR